MSSLPYRNQLDGSPSLLQFCDRYQAFTIEVPTSIFDQAYVHSIKKAVL